MNNKYLPILYIVLVCTLFSCVADKNMKRGEKYLALGEYYDAATEFKKAYSKVSSKEKAKRGERALKMAYCYDRSLQSQKAIAAYRNADRYGAMVTQELVPDTATTDSIPVKTYKTKKRNHHSAAAQDSLLTAMQDAATTDSIPATTRKTGRKKGTLSASRDDVYDNSRLRYARQLLKNGEYKSAADEFQLVLDSLNVDSIHTSSPFPTADGQSATLARNGLQSAQTAAAAKAAGSRYTVKKMDIFNSRRADYSPVLCGDQYDQLYFSSTRNEAEGDELSGITGTKPGDIFVSTKDDKGKWGKPEQVEGGVNTAYDEGACCFSVDGREMYLTQCVSDPEYPRYAQIVKSSRADAAWGKAETLEIVEDTLSAYAHPAVSPDGEWLYFVSDMPGGYGGLDIWRVRMTSANGFGGVENVGEPVNTAGNEMFPTFRPNGDLYFSSDGHPGLGGLDIFIATVGDDGRYRLEHPGYPLNSSGDDFGMTFEGFHNRGFFSSNRNDGRGWDHIYSFENPEIVQTVTGWVYEQDGYELNNAQVYIVATDGTNMKTNVKSDGSFNMEVTPGVDYLFLAVCKGYLNHKEELRIEESDVSIDHVLQFALPSISLPVVIDNVFYDFDKATLRDESITALDRLVTMLNDNPNITIELSAHTDFRGSNEYNQRLSQRRAEACVSYLIEHGIAPERLSPVGYGEDVPKTIRKKLAEKIPWLKEGDVLSEEFINALDDEKKEICHQLNRRTEFLVLRTTYGMFDENGQLKENALPKKTTADEETDDGFFDIDIE
ncbi:MAG: OmpA family protein [Prevotella sp.]|nr:OmpA family protein [Prevotella sp.]